MRYEGRKEGMCAVGLVRFLVLAVRVGLGGLSGGALGGAGTQWPGSRGAGAAMAASSAPEATVRPRMA